MTEYITGDGEQFSTLKAALNHANAVAATTGRIIAVEKADEVDPDLYKPWGEQQEQVDWLESRYDSEYYYESWDE